MSLFYPLPPLAVCIFCWHAIRNWKLSSSMYSRKFKHYNLSAVKLMWAVKYTLPPSHAHAPAKWTVDLFYYCRKNESFHRVIPQKSTTKHNHSVRNALRIDSPDLEQQPANSEWEWEWVCNVQESNKIKIIIFHLIKLYGIHSICMKVANEKIFSDTLLQ